MRLRWRNWNHFGKKDEERQRSFLTTCFQGCRVPHKSSNQEAQTVTERYLVDDQVARNIAANRN
jgi:hypothetical protein